MNEKEKIFDENTKKYGGIFLDFESEDGKRIKKNLEDVRRKLNGYYNDKKVICVTPSGVVEKIIKNINPDAQREHPRVNIYCATNTGVNAFAKRIDNEYYIGILKDVFDKTYAHIENYIMDEEFSKIPEIGMVMPQRMVQSITNYCIDYLVFHEFFHIMNGHCDYAETIGINELCEINIEISESSMDRQTMEYDADSCAIASIINEQLRDSEAANQLIPGMASRMNKDSLVQFISGLLVAIYIFTSWMNQIRYTSIEINEEQLEKMTHPLPGMRVFYMWGTISTVLHKIPYYTEEEKLEILERSMNAVFDFIERFKDIAYPGFLKKTFDFVSMKHIQKIHDNWKNVREKLTVHYNILSPYEEVDLLSLYSSRG